MSLRDRIGQRLRVGMFNVFHSPVYYARRLDMIRKPKFIWSAYPDFAVGVAMSNVSSGMKTYLKTLTRACVAHGSCSDAANLICRIGMELGLPELIPIIHRFGMHVDAVGIAVQLGHLHMIKAMLAATKWNDWCKTVPFYNSTLYEVVRIMDNDPRAGNLTWEPYLYTEWVSWRLIRGRLEADDMEGLIWCISRLGATFDRLWAVAEVYMLPQYQNLVTEARSWIKKERLP